MTGKPHQFSSVGEAFQAAMDDDGPVGERLAMVADTIRRLDPGFTGVVDRFVERLKSVGMGDGAPAVGEVMPGFVLADEDGHLCSLDAFVREGPTVIALHRGHWCPYCRINARALAETHDAIAELGGTLVVITPERAGFAAQLRGAARARYPILIDIDHGYALTLSLVTWVGAELKEALSGFGVTLDTFHGNGQWMLPVPGTFVVGTDGRVTARFIDPDFRHRMAIDDIVAAVKAAADEAKPGR